MLFLDLDRFQAVNDTLGHTMGDRLLSDVAGRLSAVMRAGDILARYGGDEFTVLLEHMDQPAFAVQVAQRRQHSLDLRFPLDNHWRQVSGSVGIALSTHGYQSADEALRDADAAMCQAKSLGSGHCVVFDPRSARPRAYSSGA